MEETDIPEPTAPTQGTRTLLNRLIAVSALVTSIVSIFLGVQNGNSMNQLVEANSWPHLSVGSANYADGQRIIKVEVVNQGVGPALLHSFVVRYKGEPVANIIELIEACCREDEGPFGSVEEFADFTKDVGTYSPAGKVIQAAEQVPVFRLNRVEGNEGLWDQLDRIRFGDLTYEACFCSVFNECWTSNMTSLEKTPVDECRASDMSWRG